jgi:hypothetical protein
MNAHATAVRRARPGIFGQVPDHAVSSAAGGVGMRLAAEVMLLPVRLLRTRLGRRLLAVAVLAVVLTTLVGSLYDHADVPSRAVGRAASLHRAAAPAAAAAPADRKDAAASPGRELGRRPEDAAASWFARRHGVARDRVQALQQERVSANERRVLVMADAGDGRLPTGYVTVRRDGSGWAVG